MSVVHIDTEDVEVEYVDGYGTENASEKHLVLRDALAGKLIVVHGERDALTRFAEKITTAVQRNRDEEVVYRYTLAGLDSLAGREVTDAEAHSIVKALDASQDITDVVYSVCGVPDDEDDEDDEDDDEDSPFGHGAEHAFDEEEKQQYDAGYEAGTDATLNAPLDPEHSMGPCWEYGWRTAQRDLNRNLRPNA